MVSAVNEYKTSFEELRVLSLFVKAVIDKIILDLSAFFTFNDAYQVLIEE